MKKTIFISALVALIVSMLAIGGFYKYFGQKQIKIEHITKSPAKKVLYADNGDGELAPLDFTVTAEKVMDAVVHIRSTQTIKTRGGGNYHGQNNDYFDDQFFKKFFGPENSPQDQYHHGQPPARVGTGSGVIIDPNGYIVTNYHVIEDADDIEVTLFDNRAVKAKIIGTDKNTDLALLKIRAESLPVLPFTNSDEVKVGEWVLAVGNPFNLNSTVTAGIVSAKGRNINILNEQYAVESFIQTDAAINPGNSGGALVNLNGGLIGINTAIASPTGSYSGYGFAVPSNIVNKVVEDLLKYGEVQRGYLGILIRGVDSRLAKEYDLEITEGIFVDSLLENSAAKAAGVESGDVIIAIDEVEVLTVPELQEAIAQHHPGDKVSVKLIRDGEEKEIDVILNNSKGNTEMVVKEKNDVLDVLGADFEDIDSKTARKLGIESGIRVADIRKGKIQKYTDLRKGFIITKVNDKAVKNVKSFLEYLETVEGGVMLEGVYEDYPGSYFYAFGMNS